MSLTNRLYGVAALAPLTAPHRAAIPLAGHLEHLEAIGSQIEAQEKAWRRIYDAYQAGRVVEIADFDTITQNARDADALGRFTKKQFHRHYNRQPKVRA